MLQLINNLVDFLVVRLVQRAKESTFAPVLLWALSFVLEATSLETSSLAQGTKASIAHHQRSSSLDSSFSFDSLSSSSSSSINPLEHDISTIETSSDIGIAEMAGLNLDSSVVEVSSGLFEALSPSSFSSFSALESSDSSASSSSSSSSSPASPSSPVQLELPILVEGTNDIITAAFETEDGSLPSHYLEEKETLVVVASGNTPGLVLGNLAVVEPASPPVSSITFVESIEDRFFPAGPNHAFRVGAKEFRNFAALTTVEEEEEELVASSPITISLPHTSPSPIINRIRSNSLPSILIDSNIIQEVDKLSLFIQSLDLQTPSFNSTDAALSSPPLDFGIINFDALDLASLTATPPATVDSPIKFAWLDLAVASLPAPSTDVFLSHFDFPSVERPASFPIPSKIEVELSFNVTIPEAVSVLEQVTEEEELELEEEELTVFERVVAPVPQCFIATAKTHFSGFRPVLLKQMVNGELLYVGSALARFEKGMAKEVGGGRWW